MKEVFGKTKITSREFPVILFDAGGTIFHPNPSYEKVYQSILAENGIVKSDEEIDVALLASLRKFNEQSESDENFELKPSMWAEVLLGFLNSDTPELRRAVQTSVSSKVKMVISQATEDVLLQLRDRGYRLGIVSNWNGVLADLLRDQDLLPYFDTVITSIEIGAAKPKADIFSAAIEDLDLEPAKTVFVGESYAADMVGAKRLGFKKILYDPRFRELRALWPADTSGKVVSIEALKHNRRLSDICLISRFEELLEIFT